MRGWLAACPPQWPLMDAIRLAIVNFNKVPPEDERWHRRRMQLILERCQVLQAHSTLRYAEWRQVIADFVAERTGQSACALLFRRRSPTRCWAWPSPPRTSSGSRTTTAT